MRRWRFGLLFCLIVGANWAQQFRSSISGSVLDQTGAAVPGADITATQVETSAKFTTKSTADGHYTITQIPPGTYRVIVDAPGFKHFTREGLQVNADQALQIDLKLELGAETEMVNVTEEAPMLDTADASSGEVISTHQVENMPLNGRSPLTLAELAPGVVSTSTASAVHPYDNGGESAWAMGGGSAQQNELLMDGSEDTRPGTGQVAYVPPVDATQQVLVQTFNVNAAYGHTGGGTINMITKSGTNDLHGSAYEFNEVSALGANTWLSNKGGLQKPVTRQNQYGLTFGGPVFLPRLYNGKDKLFWFFAFEGIKAATPDAITLTVPTAAERQGDFSALLRLGPQYQIYNPFMAVAQGTAVLRQPFANNMIPPGDLNPVAQAILKYVPLPNVAGALESNYIYSGASTDSFNNELGRLDYNLSDRQKVYFNFRHNFRLENRLNWFNNAATGRQNGRDNWGSTFDDVYTFTPTAVLDTRLNWTRYVDTLSFGAPNFNFAQLGLPASLAAASTHLSFPVISFGSTTYAGLGANAGTGIGGTPSTVGDVLPEDSYQIFSTLSKVASAHSLQMGVDLRSYRSGVINYGYSSGLFNFSTAWTNGPLSTAPGAPIGQELAAFLLGLPSSGQFDVPAEGSYRQNYYAVFLEDDWRVRANLTLNLGLRYDKDMPITERYNRNVNGFDFTATNPIQAAAQAAYARNPIPQLPVSQFTTPGGLTFPTPAVRNITNPSSHLFSPRVGFAWTPFGPSSKTVIRGGFGLFMFPLSILQGGSSPVIQSGFSQTTPLVATNNNFLTPYATLSNPFPTGLASPSPLGLATFVGQSVSFYNPYPLNPYSLRWNFSIQQQLAHNYLIEVDYEGNHGVHLQENQPLNYLPLRYLTTSPVRDQNLTNLLQGSVSNPFAGLLPGTSLNGSTVQRQQLLLPFPQYTGLTEVGVNDAGSYYEMGFIRFEKRYSNGFQFLAIYQHSRLEQRSIRLNPQTALIKMISPDDRPNHVVASGSYDVPVGHGRTFLANSPAAVNALLGGWVVNAIFTFTSGPPLSWGNVIYNGGPIDLNPANPDATFNTSVFDRASADQPNSFNVRTFPQYFNNLRADSLMNIDASLLKNFSVREKFRFQFRGEAFNLLNHPVYGGPILSPTSQSFGIVTGGQQNSPRAIQLGLRVTW
ncbi:MAG: TonB-dependent receptor [Acidobacteriaceae bacterium]|nr:TonB-dependent receptor [Acidobacteriaceae bacterium]